MKENINVLYIDDSISDYVKDALKEIKIEEAEQKYYVKCDDFEFHIDDEIDEIFEYVKENEIDIVFIDSLLYSGNPELKPHGIWIALMLKEYFPHVRVCTISSQNLSEESYDSYAIPYFPKIDKDTPEKRTVILNKYKEFISKHVVYMQQIEKIRSTFEDRYHKLDNKKEYSIFEQMLKTINKMKDGQRAITDEQIKNIISKLESFINEKL